MPKLLISKLFVALVCYGGLYSQDISPQVTLYDVGDVISIPIYPRVAAASGKSGELLVSIVIEKNGFCRIAGINGNSKFFINAMRRAVLKWKFLPRNEVYSMNIKVEFVLLPADSADPEIVSEIFPKLNKIIIKSRRPFLE